jgi:TldD protein
VRQALVNLESVPAPAGTMTVVLGPAGRRAAARGDRPRPRGRLQPQGHVGFTGASARRVASELCTVVDDGTLRRRRGSLNIDDEGTPTHARR